MARPNPLRGPVDAFVASVGPVVVDIGRGAGTADPDRLTSDVTLEAYNLTAAFLDADGRHTDEELRSFVDVFGDRIATVARAATPRALRSSGLVTGRRVFLDRPSELFELLVHADAGTGSEHAWRYYLAALRIAHAVGALDAHPSREELLAVERFRTMLLARMDALGASRPGGPPRPRPEATPTPATGAEAPEAAEPAEPPEPARAIEDLLAELEELVGLDAVKTEVKLVTNLLRVEKLREERGLPVVEHSRHLVFTGNPGTGKTTVARLLAQIYRTLGVVDKGHLVEIDRSGLVAGYVGQTAIRVREVFGRAMGGVLLVDEAHALARGNERDFGHEAIDMIVKLMEDHRDDVVLIVAGYPDEMDVFLDANPGLRSRFPKTIYFEDYTDEELVRIFAIMCAKARYTPTDGAKAAVLAHLGACGRDRGFGNARLVRNLFEAAVAHQASRVVDLADLTDEALVTLEAADIPRPGS